MRRYAKYFKNLGADILQIVQKVAATFILLTFMVDYLNSIKELNYPTEIVDLN